MGKRDLTTPQQRLKYALEQRGWLVAEVRDENLPWWAYEIWVLESTWSPAGTRLLLTYVLDPMFESGPKRRWLDRAVASLVELPGYLCEGRLAQMTMRHGWESELDSFVRTLDDVRGEWAREIEKAPPN